MVKPTARYAAIDGLGRGKGLAITTGRLNTPQSDPPPLPTAKLEPTRNPEEAYFFLFGFVEYEDVSGEVHRSCFNFMRGRTDTEFVNAGDATYWLYT